MTSKDKISLLSSVWNATFGKKVEDTKDENKEASTTKMAADEAPAAGADAAKAPEAPADVNAKLDEVLKAIAGLSAKMGEMETSKAADAVAMSAIKDTVGGLIEANTLMSSELIEMKNIPQGDVAGKASKTEDKTASNEENSTLTPQTNTYKNLMSRLKERSN